MYFSHSCYIGLLSNNPKNRQEQRPICFYQLHATMIARSKGQSHSMSNVYFMVFIKCELMGGANLQTYTKELSRKYPKGER